MNTETYIAVAFGSPGGATAEISNAIEGLIGKRPKPIRLDDLAGPNETIQMLLSVEDWIRVAEVIAAIYGTELLKEAAKATWKAAAPKLDHAKDTVTSYFSNLVSAIQQAMRANAPVILGYPRNPVGSQRHIGVEIYDASPEEIGRIITTLAFNGQEINIRLDKLDQRKTEENYIIYERNSDFSVKITITDEGKVEIHATVVDAKDPRNQEVINYELSKQKHNSG
jgi:hypothetical protein